MPKYIGNTSVPTEFSTLITAVDDAKVDKAGDTLTGDLAMGDNSITGLADPVNDKDAATKSYVNILGGYATWHLSGVSLSTDAFMSRTTTTGWPISHYIRKNIALDGAVIYFDSEASTFSGGTISINIYKGGTTTDSGILLYTEVISPLDLTLLNEGEESDNTGSWNEWVVEISSADLDDNIDAGEHLSVHVDGTSSTGASGIELMVEVYYVRR